jgi:serine/threonine protein kinase
MIELRAEDGQLTGLDGAVIPSLAFDGVQYELERSLGAGTFSVAFYAVRRAADGESPAVLKVLRPNMLRRDGTMASLVVEKERTALQRLADRVPPTPFVVQLMDADSVPVKFVGRALRLPWLALEYVHGGAEGTTLEERIDFSIEKTGYAFDATRASQALRCLASGLEAVHEVGVVHRDLTTWNVLCCGFGVKEVFKISDFGIARPTGHQGTFIGSPGGTAGFAPPEQVLGEKEKVGPGSDVFALAAIVYRMLTADHYFPATNTLDGVLLAQRNERRPLTDGARLTPELRERRETCRVIDAVLARATAYEAAHRPTDSWEVAQPIIDALQGAPVSSRLSQRVSSVSTRPPPRRESWVWRVRHHPGDDRIVRSVSWDSDGTCLAATADGLAFWDGTSWRTAPTSALPFPEGIRFVHRVGAGAWLVGGDRATIARYSPEGVSGVVQGADPEVTYVEASGDLSELAVLVGKRGSEPPLLFPRCDGHWLEPAVLSRATAVFSLSRLEPDRWLMCGRARSGSGFAVVYAPRSREVKRIETGATRAFVACRANRDLGVGLVVGASGRTLRVGGGHTREVVVEGEPDLSAVAIEPGGLGYAASTGCIWLQQLDCSWRCVWCDPTWSVPFVSLFADTGLVIGMTADGGIIEGRWE